MSWWDVSLSLTHTHTHMVWLSLLGPNVLTYIGKYYSRRRFYSSSLDKEAYKSAKTCFCTNENYTLYHLHFFFLCRLRVIIKMFLWGLMRQCFVCSFTPALCLETNFPCRKKTSTMPTKVHKVFLVKIISHKSGPKWSEDKNLRKYLHLQNNKPNVILYIAHIHFSRQNITIHKSKWSLFILGAL